MYLLTGILLISSVCLSVCLIYHFWEYLKKSIGVSNTYTHLFPLNEHIPMMVASSCLVIPSWKWTFLFPWHLTYSFAQRIICKTQHFKNIVTFFSNIIFNFLIFKCFSNGYFIVGLCIYIFLPIMRFLIFILE